MCTFFSKFNFKTYLRDLFKFKLFYVILKLNDISYLSHIGSLFFNKQGDSKLFCIAVYFIEYFFLSKADHVLSKTYFIGKKEFYFEEKNINY